MKKNKTILITGGAGRIGKILANDLLKEGHKVVLADIKISKPKKNIFYTNKNLFVFKSDLTKEKNIISCYW